MPPEATTEPVVQPVTVGRIVHLFPNEYHREFIQKTSGGNLLVAGEPVAAVIVRVWNPDMVNLKVITDGRHDVWLPSVGSPKFMGTHESRNTYWDWPARS